MKSPKISNPTPSVKPTAPESSTSGIVEQQARQKKKQGLFSTLLGQGTGVSNRLASYLSNSNATSNTSTPANTRTRPGGATVA